MRNTQNEIKIIGQSLEHSTEDPNSLQSSERHLTTEGSV